MPISFIRTTYVMNCNANVVSLRNGNTAADTNIQIQFKSDDVTGNGYTFPYVCVVFRLSGKTRESCRYG